MAKIWSLLLSAAERWAFLPLLWLLRKLFQGQFYQERPNAQKRVKKSEYAMQLNEKQKVKFIYGILEKQFRMYYEKAVASEGITGEVLLTTIERRLDNVVFRLGWLRPPVVLPVRCYPRSLHCQRQTR